jgi:sugar lactone lactonase YvrE
MRHSFLIALVAAFSLAACNLSAATDGPEADAAKYAKPGFHVALEDGRLWVLREGSDDLAAFLEHGEPAKQVVRPAAGPDGLTIKSVDGETITAYLLTRPGFWVTVEDGRLWVFREGSEELAAFLQHGEPAKQVVRPAAGPDGITLKAVDGEVLDDYLAAPKMPVGRRSDRSAATEGSRYTP